MPLGISSLAGYGGSYSGQVQASQARQREEQERYYARIAPTVQMREASRLAEGEAERERQFEEAQRTAAYSRAREFASSIFAQYEAAAGAEDTTGRGAAQEALEASISERGAEAQSELSSLLARRGIFRSGAGAAAAAELTGETEAQVAQSRASYAESEAERRSREREAAINQALQAFQIGGTY